MPDARPPTPGALESLLADAGHETFISFVADLLAREGRDVRREGPVIVAEGPDGHRDRVLVWTDERNAIGRLLGSGRSRSDPGPVDAVVARDRDRTSTAAIAESHDAEVIDTDELHDRLLYSIDREACLDLCREHVGVAVVPVAVTPADGTRLGALPPGDSRALRWNLTTPESAAGEYSLVVGATFTGPDGLSNRTVSIDYSVYVGPPGAESGRQRAPSGAKTSIGENN